MCLAVPARIKKLTGDSVGIVDYMGSELTVNVSLVPGIKKGDYVIVHAGFAISRLDKKEARKTLALFKELADSEPN